MNKRRITLQIANNPLTIVTDEDEAFVGELTDELNSRFSSLMRANIRITPLDAALLCSIDYLSEKKKADARIESLKKELDLCKSRLKQTELFSATPLSESDSQTEPTQPSKPVTASGDAGDTAADQTEGVRLEKAARTQSKDRRRSASNSVREIKNDKSPDSSAGTGATAEEKIRALEKYLESKKSSDVASAARDAREREEKIKYIESLLRGGSKSRSEKTGEKKTGAESGLKDVSPSENSSSDIPKERNDG